MRASTFLSLVAALAVLALAPADVEGRTCVGAQVSLGRDGAVAGACRIQLYVSEDGPCEELSDSEAVKEHIKLSADESSLSFDVIATEGTRSVDICYADACTRGSIPTAHKVYTLVPESPLPPSTVIGVFYEDATGGRWSLPSGSLSIPTNPDSCAEVAGPRDERCDCEEPASEPLAEASGEQPAKEQRAEPAAETGGCNSAGADPRGYHLTATLLVLMLLWGRGRRLLIAA